MEIEFKYYGFNIPKFNKIMGCLDGFYGIVLSEKKFIGISYHSNIALLRPFKFDKSQKKERVIDIWFYLFFSANLLSFRFKIN